MTFAALIPNREDYRDGWRFLTDMIEGLSGTDDEVTDEQHVYLAEAKVPMLTDIRIATGYDPATTEGLDAINALVDANQALFREALACKQLEIAYGDKAGGSVEDRNRVQGKKFQERYESLKATWASLARSSTTTTTSFTPISR